MELICFLGGDFEFFLEVFDAFVGVFERFRDFFEFLGLLENLRFSFHGADLQAFDLVFQRAYEDGILLALSREAFVGVG